jgi:hypothetical protein
LMVASIPLEEFSPLQLPMNSSLWKENLALSHPLCDMRASFVVETMSLNHRNASNTHIFLAFDGRGDISDYESIGVVLSKHFTGNGADNMGTELKFLDMFVAMHSEFFVLNPLSTFSWEIYIIRVCLGLESVPVMQTRDIYFMTSVWYAYYKRRATDGWVSYTSIVDAHNRLYR